MLELTTRQAASPFVFPLARTDPALIAAIAQFSGHAFYSGHARKSGLIEFVWRTQRQELRIQSRIRRKAEQRGNSAKDIFEFKHAVSPVQ